MMQQAVHGPAEARDAGLDAVRGIAALAVVMYHCSLGFMPFRMTFFIGGPTDPRTAMWMRFWFAPFSGPSAVLLFFVLSGFVLTRASFARGSVLPLLRTAVKRYPRLAGPVLIACLLAWALFRFGLQHNAQASALTGSGWLGAFGTSPGPLLGAAVRQGLWRTLLQGDVSYNTSLWTMPAELTGSFYALGIAAIMVAVRRDLGSAAERPGRVGGVAAVLLGIFAFCYLKNSPSYLNYFVAGVTLSALLTFLRPPPMPSWVAAIVLLAALYLVGYTQPVGDYAWIRRVPRAYIGLVQPALLASLLFILTVETCPSVRGALNMRVFRWLGRISFSLYLVHFLVIISVGCMVRLWADPLGGKVATLAAFVSVLTVSLAVATPLAWFDAWFMRQLNRIVDRAPVWLADAWPRLGAAPRPGAF